MSRDSARYLLSFPLLHLFLLQFWVGSVDSAVFLLYWYQCYFGFKDEAFALFLSFGYASTVLHLLCCFLFPWSLSLQCSLMVLWLVHGKVKIFKEIHSKEFILVKIMIVENSNCKKKTLDKGIAGVKLQSFEFTVEVSCFVRILLLFWSE